MLNNFVSKTDNQSCLELDWTINFLKQTPKKLEVMLYLNSIKWNMIHKIKAKFPIGVDQENTNILQNGFFKHGENVGKQYKKSHWFQVSS